jgi:hypothetical protein
MSRRRWIVGAGALLLLAAALYAARGLHPPAGPRVQVDGGDAGGLPRASPEAERLDASGLERATQDPAALGLEAFVVMRHDHLVFERYGNGLTGQSVVDTGSFAPVLVGLLSGIALQETLLPPQVLNSFDPNRLRAAIETGAQQRYESYLSRKLWRRLNAGTAWIALPTPTAATPADCCFQARVLDWMRVASLLLDDGRFEGTQVVPRGWVERMERPLSADGTRGFGVVLAAPAPVADPYAVPGVISLRGAGHWRLWMVPQLQLAILFGAEAPRQSIQPQNANPWSETRLPNLVISTAIGVALPQSATTPLQQLVPAH